MVSQWPCSPPLLLLPLKSPSLRPGSAGGGDIPLRIHWYILKVCFYQVSSPPHWYSLPQTLNTAGYSSTNPGMQWDLESTPMHLCSPTVHLDCMRSREGSMNGGDMKLHSILGSGSVKKMAWPLFKLLRFLSAFFGHYWSHHFCGHNYFILT